ncbi:hypothetical protein [Aliikangiella coralliicola]|uniref:DUF2306 domain-containing protein n=1 Tax=Aliikangiella coralliicola TaxID=2592383 RepID=A0A545UIF6_9GAMM|nr:hypothetical protein [Aliikangiella coralliicola]TQV89251.1 hypothetical protein FLL46_03735 [Aliikangiella coralliicola]
MPQLIHQIAFYIHVIAGSIALVVFWLPIFAKKGDKKHRRFGQLFVNGMYAVSISGVLMTLFVLVDPIGVRAPERNLDIEQAYNLAYQNRVFAGFLLMLSILVFSNVKQSVLVLKVKAQRELLKTRFHIGTIIFLGMVGLVVGWIGFSEQLLLLQIFSVLSVLNSIGMLHYIYKSNLKQREWIIAHLGNILGAGIGAYTAFFAFGGSRLFSEILTGNLQVIPWIAPGVIGVVSSIYLTKKYQQQFRVA